jgi:proline iminopeptidase
MPLFPAISPYQKSLFQKGRHHIYYEQSGNPEGKPVIFLHGGPGGGGDENARRFFDPLYYRIIVMDQRGAGRSSPLGCVEENTTWDLIDDIHDLKQRLCIDRWMVFGGSWGSTLAMAYAQSYPKEVSELVLRGIFMLRKKEIDWFYQQGASFIYPEEWIRYISIVPASKRGDFLGAYHQLLHFGTEIERVAAAQAWSRWEGATSCLTQSKALIDHFTEDKFSFALALIETHYFKNKGFFSTEDYLLRNIDKIRHIPTVIVQGRYDMVCPIETAYELHAQWPEAEFIVAKNSGHSAYESEITDYLVGATNQFLHKERNEKDTN